MQRLLVLPLVLVLGLLLAACGSETVSAIYTAAGDGSRTSDLTRTTSFRADDDLNLVVELGTHTRTLEITATFTAPDGTAYSTDPIEAESTVSTLVLGLDWESMGIGSWQAGSWRAELFINGEQEEELTFSVQAPASSDAEG